MPRNLCGDIRENGLIMRFNEAEARMPRNFQ